MVLDHAIDTGAPRTATKTGTKLRDVGRVTGGNHLNVAILRVAHPAAQFELGSLALHEPAESDTLNTPLDEKMENHEDPTSASVADGKRGLQAMPQRE
jgi:hypothetical protein